MNLYRSRFKFVSLAQILQGSLFQRSLNWAITAAFQILTSVDHGLSNPALWYSSSRHPQQQWDPTLAAGGGGGGGGPGHGLSLDEARHRYKTALAALRASVSAVPCCAQEIGPTGDKADTAEIKRLKDRASALRKEIESKNKDVKSLVDHLRDLISDVSMWQSSSIS